ncbi:glycosyltransferase family 2 protein [Candidatus Microgenomates bacterium]|nr:glycosyltransferase family 2 protein [Candidatus Microgenomates bacterium]
MKYTPPFSIVIAAYNEEDYLEATLAAIRRQTIPDYELIVVDNASRDKTAEIAKHYGAKVIREIKQGYVYALNTGLKSATGDILVVTDADTILPPHCLAEIQRAFKPGVVALTGGLRYNTSSPIINNLVRHTYHAFIWLHFLIDKPHLTGSCMAIRREVFEKIGGLNTDLKVGADVGMGLAARKYGRVVYVPRIAATASHRRWKSNGLTSMRRYIQAYINVVWRNKPTDHSLTPVR